MYQRILTIVLSLFFLYQTSQAQTRILTIGDSTMANYDEEKNSGEKEKRGWAQMLPVFFDETVRIENAAKNGRSSKSFYYEFWGNLRESLKPGDYVFIQFGHNDEKNNGEDSSEDDHSQRGTAAWGQYQKHLSMYVNESRERGATPILFTPVVRRLFDGNKKLNDNAKHNLSAISGNDSTMNYPKAMTALARELSVPLIDMTTLTQNMVEEYGAEKSKQIIYAQNDNTHLKAMGGILFSELAVEELLKQNLLSEHISIPSGLTVKPTKHDFGMQFTGKPSVKSFHFVGLDLNPDSGNIDISVKKPFSISESAKGTFGSQLSIPFHSGVVNTQIFVQFTPDKAKKYSDKMTIISNNKKQEDILLKGEGFSGKGGKEVKAEWSPIQTSEIKTTGTISANTQTSNMKFVTMLDDHFLTIEGDIWPAGDIDLNASRYIEFSVEADKGELYIDSVMFQIEALGGNEMNFTALGSTEPSFVNPESFVVMESLPNKKNRTYTFNTIVKVPKGERFYLRLFPWYKNAIEGKYLKLDKILIKGLVFEN